MSSIAINENPAARGLLAWRARADWWVLPAAIGVIALAAVVYLWNLTVSGFANTYYSMAAQAASQSWSAWFWGSLDAANFITVDKPPLATMAMGLSVRLFGLSSGAILLPEAIFGVATVALLYAIVRRQFGPAAATLAALVAALTPAAVLMFRYNNPDALLTLLLVGAAGALLRALENSRLRWVVVSALLVGLAFNTKFLQAYLVLPAFALVYLIAARGGLLRRLGHLVVAGLTVVLASGWWVAAVELTPAASRPFIGGSTNNSAVQLLLGYDGLQRILGWFGFDGSTTAVPGVDGGGIFGGVPGLLRMFNSEFGGQIAWFLSAALVGLAVGLIARRGAARTDLRRAAYLLWGGWLVVHAAVFSFMSGIVHSYYAVAMVPAIGALVGAGAMELWSAKARGGRIGTAAAVTLGATVAGTAFLAALLLWRSPEFMPWLAPVVAASGLLAGAALAVPNLPRRAVAMAAAMGLAVVLAGPIAYSVGTVNAPHTGGDPQAGPFLLNDQAGPGTGGPLRGFGGPAGGAGGIGSTRGPLPIGGGFGQIRALTPQLFDYLVANKGDATWLVAVRSANEAAQIQLATGQPAMAMGGFSGTDQALSLTELELDVASGRLRYILIENAAPPFGPSADGLARSAVVNWVTEHGKVVTEVGGGALYDLGGGS
jgi:4-amino-4-deoxy-L-arabinose transferase-like glycosyltransferase